MGHVEVTGIGRMQQERNKQIDKGYTYESDFEDHLNLLRAAACYMDYAANLAEGMEQDIPHPFWPWDAETWNPGNAEEAMIKAGAMAAAVYDALYAEGVGYASEED